MTQLSRVIKAADSLRGVCQVDFLGSETIDGGKPITRLAARIQDAEDRGYVFESLGTRNACKVYRLVSRPEIEAEGSADERRPATGSRDVGLPLAGTIRQASSAPPSPDPEPLFDAPPQPRPHWREEAA